MINRRIEFSLLKSRLNEMIIEEEEKKEEKDERLLADLCECYLLLSSMFSNKLRSICVSCLLKVALNKEENEETQKEVEIAFMALSYISQYVEIKKDLFLNDMKEIIQYHQKHHNLTRLAYQSAWGFLMNRFYYNKSLEDYIANELHFGREAATELEELTRSVDWERKEEERGKGREEEDFIMRWIETLNNFFRNCRLWNEDFVKILSSISCIFRAAKDNHKEIRERCINFLQIATKIGAVKIDDLLKGKATDAVLEKIQQPTLDERVIFECFKFFIYISRRLKLKKKDEKEEMKRKEMVKKTFEKLEEEGYEDVIIGFQETFAFLNGIYFNSGKLSLNISDYLVDAC
ncbi:uncharacterized protein MONOS_17613 [Monocercomonoides exilis]|uniref:uncharacterized protein n=1 Tax=Monocercomonoides exilis TaxID=2049356 RepID=UPI00355AA596|nr:hypothetical protein MONOS_17613 [Monocercomonoides exilis]